MPDALRHRIEDALDGATNGDDPLAESLLALAGEMLSQLNGGRDRRDALTLLAADALATFGCEYRAARAAGETDLEAPGPGVSVSAR